MPRDWHLLPLHSQILLRTARAARLCSLSTPPVEEEKEKGEEEDDARETHIGYTARKWMQIQRHLEEPEPEYLAKRRKGMPSAGSGRNANGDEVANGPMRETMMKKMDVDGNVHIYKVLAAEGQAVDGEVAHGAEGQPDTAPEEAAPGTVVEGVGIVNAEGVVVANQTSPSRRKLPPPRRKAKKCPGRGRKKLMFTPGEGPDDAMSAADASSLGGDLNMVTDGSPAPGDTPMAEGAEEDDDDGGSDADDDDEHREASPTPGRSTLMPKAGECQLQAMVVPNHASVIPTKRRAGSHGGDASSRSPQPALTGASRGSRDQSPAHCKMGTLTPEETSPQPDKIVADAVSAEPAQEKRPAADDPRDLETQFEQGEGS